MRVRCPFTAQLDRNKSRIFGGMGLDGRNFVSPVIIDGTNSSPARGKRCAARAA